jgi:hypothetical protein
MRSRKFSRLLFFVATAMVVISQQSFAQISLASTASTSTVIVCRGELDGAKIAISIRLNSTGHIVEWSEDRLADTTDDGPAYNPLSIFADPTAKEYEFWDIQIRGELSQLQLVTTADAHTLSLNPRDLSAKYVYEDRGSGNGDSEFMLTCATN